MTDLAVVCDFDGTATVHDIGDEISKHFCGADYLAVQKKLFADGELTTRAIIQSIYTPIRAPESPPRPATRRKARYNSTKMIISVKGTTTASRWVARSRYSNCPDHETE